MNGAFFIIATPVTLVVIGFCVVLRQAGLPFPARELLVPVVVLLGATFWWMAKKAKRKSVNS